MGLQLTYYSTKHKDFQKISKVSSNRIQPATAANLNRQNKYPESNFYQLTPAMHYNFSLQLLLPANATVAQ